MRDQRAFDLIDAGRISPAGAQSLVELYDGTISELERLNDPGVTGLVRRLQHLREHVQELQAAQRASTTGV